MAKAYGELPTPSEWEVIKKERELPPTINPRIIDNEYQWLYEALESTIHRCRIAQLVIRTQNYKDLPTALEDLVEFVQNDITMEHCVAKEGE